MGMENVIAATKVIATLVDLVGAAVAGNSDISDKEFAAAIKEYADAKVILKELKKLAGG